MSNGVAPYTWSASAGSLPAGLSLNTSTGAITGTPTTAGAYSFTLSVTDNTSATDTQAYSGTVSAVAVSNIAIVNYGGEPNCNVSATATLSLTAGNVVAVSVGVFNGVPTSVTDNLGNTYTLVEGSVCSGAGSVYMAWYTAPVINAGAATITLSHNGSFQSITAVQVSGINTSTPVDTSVGYYATTLVTPIVSPQFTTTQANTIILAGAHHDSGTGGAYTWSTGVTNLLGDGSFPERPIGYDIVDTVQTNRTVSVACSGGSFSNISVVVLRGA